MRHTISEINIEKVEPKNGLIGFCDFVLDGKIRFKSVAIFSRLEGGIRLSYPEKQRGIKRIKTAEPIHHDTFKEIESSIFVALEDKSTLKENLN